MGLSLENSMEAFAVLQPHSGDVPGAIDKGNFPSFLYSQKLPLWSQTPPRHLSTDTASKSLHMLSPSSETKSW
jgi:hypothetical protein